jgi:hypothetical protein
MIIYPNYTFSVPDKRLYTLYKGITVTPRLVQASRVSSYSQATFTRYASCLYFIRRPFTCPAQPRVTAPLRQGRGYRSRYTFSAEPAHDSTPTTMGFRGVSPGLPSPLQHNVPAVWCFKPTHTFGAKGPPPSGSPRVRAVPAKQRSHNLSSIRVIIKSSLHTSAKTRFIRSPKSATGPDVAYFFRRLFSPTVALVSEGRPTL